MIAKARVSGLLARTVQQPRTRASERARGALPSLALSLSLPRLALLLLPVLDPECT
jgi:hypothetical protein